MAAVIALVIGAHAAAVAAKDGRGTAHTVRMDGTTFVPGEIVVTLGDTVKWTNADPFPHTVTSRRGGFDSRAVDAGHSWTYHASRRGEFDYVCAYHPTMTGRVRVE
jgi:plastocyanin